MLEIVDIQCRGDPRLAKVSKVQLWCILSPQFRQNTWHRQDYPKLRPLRLRWSFRTEWCYQRALSSQNTIIWALRFRFRTFDLKCEDRTKILTFYSNIWWRCTRSVLCPWLVLSNPINTMNRSIWPRELSWFLDSWRTFCGIVSWEETNSWWVFWRKLTMKDTRRSAKTCWNKNRFQLLKNLSHKVGELPLHKIKSIGLEKL